MRTQRETIVLVAAATGLTFALSHVVHRHNGMSRPSVPEQAWTGGLADVAAPKVILASTEPLTSASLVVPKSELALPEPALQPLVKMRGCGGQSCAPKPTGASAPVRRTVVEDETDMQTVITRRPIRRRTTPSLIARLNPLNHLPYASAIKRPFVIAGDTVSGWFKRF